MENVQIVRYSSGLQNEDRKKRKRSLEDIRRDVFENETRLKEDVLDEIFEQLYKYLLQCLSDKAEICRELAACLLCDFMKELPSVEKYLIYVIPVLLQRLGAREIEETSEEVRLILTTLLRVVVKKSSKTLLPYFDDVVQILSKTLVDPYPKVKKESCECVSELAKAIPREFHMQSETLVKPMIPILTHQHYRIRVTAIQSIGDAVQFGNNKSVDDVATHLAERLFDQTPMVRLAVTNVAGNWLLNLYDRYSYFHKLLPLLLTSFHDDYDEVKSAAESFWDAVGQQYMKENEEDLKDRLDFLSDDRMHYPPGVKRPNLGCRTLVYRNLMQIIPALLRDLDDWMVEIRIKSSQLLYTLLLNAESNMTQHLEKILTGIYRACNDEEHRVVSNVSKAAELIGYFVPPVTYCKIMIPILEETCTVGHLIVLSSVIKGTEKSALVTQIEDIALLLQRHDVCRSSKGAYQVQLLNCCLSLMEVAGEDASLVSWQLFTVIITVHGLAVDHHVVERCSVSLDKLRQVEGLSSLEQLYGKHMEKMLGMLGATVDSWTITTPEKFMFEVLISNAGSVVGQHFQKILQILTASVKPEKDAEVRLKMFTTFSSVLAKWKGSLARCEDSQNAVAKIIEGMVIPNLVWHAGRTAAAVRTAAVCCLWSSIQGDSVSQVSLLPLLDKLVPLLCSVVEESSKTCRLLTCQVIHKISSICREELPKEHMEKLYLVVMKRLDDANDDVRIQAAKTLIVLFKNLPEECDRGFLDVHLETVLGTMLIHLDDPEPKIQEVILDGLKALGPIHPKIIKEKLSATKQNYRNQQGCDELLQFLMACAS